LLTAVVPAAVVAAMGICLSAWASNPLASSLSFFSLAITLQAASCCQDKT